MEIIVYKEKGEEGPLTPIIMKRSLLRCELRVCIIIHIIRPKALHYGVIFKYSSVGLSVVFKYICLKLSLI